MPIRMPTAVQLVRPTFTMRKTPDTQPVAERLLDALERCFNQRGFDKTSLTDVAAEAGVSRMTIYRHYANRQALFDAAVIRNLSKEWQVVADKLQHCTTLDDWLVQAVLIFIRQFEGDETVQLYMRAGGFGEGLAVALTPHGLKTVHQHFELLYDNARKQNLLAPGLKIEEIAEWLSRNIYSLLAYPSPRIRRRADLERWLRSQVCGGLVQAS